MAAGLRAAPVPAGKTQQSLCQVWAALQADILTQRSPADTVGPRFIDHLQQESVMADLRLNFACGPYDRTQALRDGTIKPDGIDLTYLTMQPAEIFWRMLQYNEFQACEMSLSNTTTMMSGPNPPFIAIPVYPSRVFRHGYFFINTNKG